jgi:hypothetical protein
LEWNPVGLGVTIRRVVFLAGRSSEGESGGLEKGDPDGGRRAASA